MGKLNKDQKQLVGQLYKDGFNTSQLAEQWNVSPETIRRALCALAIERRSREVYNRSYECDHEYFDCIDHADKAYWLGFLAADGYIGSGNMVWVDLGIADADHLSLLRKSLSSTHPVHTDARRARFFLRSQRLVASLANNGIGPRKTLCIRWPTLPTQWLPHYLRGYFDGDGSITRDRRSNSLRWQITSNDLFLSGARAYLMSVCNLGEIKLTRLYPVTPVYSLVYGGSGQTLKIAELMYGEGGLCLARKKNRILQYLVNNPRIQDRYAASLSWVPSRPGTENLKTAPASPQVHGAPAGD